MVRNKYIINLFLLEYILFIILYFIIGSIPYSGISFLVFHSLKSYWQKYSELDSLRLWLSGGVAGVIGLSITYPIDTLRKLKQVKSILNSEVGSYNFPL